LKVFLVLVLFLLKHKIYTLYFDLSWHNKLYLLDNNFQNIKYIFYVLKGIEPELEKLSKGTGVPGLNRNDVYNLKIPLPSIEEQEKLVIEIEKLEKEINQLKEENERTKKEIEKIIKESL